MKNDKPQELLQELFTYEAGKFFWKIRTSNRTEIGKEAGYYCQNGYMYVNVKSVKMKRSRAVWIFHNGPIPDKLIVEHRSQNKLDDSIENLRLATTAENLYNTRLRKNKLSSYKGVALRRDKKKWTARIMVDKKEIHLGSFITELAAAQAYDAALIKYAGEFAHTNEDIYADRTRNSTDYLRVVCTSSDRKQRRETKTGGG